MLFRAPSTLGPDTGLVPSRLWGRVRVEKRQRPQQEHSIVDAQIAREAGSRDVADALIEVITADSESGQDFVFRGPAVGSPVYYELDELTVERVDCLEPIRPSSAFGSSGPPNHVAPPRVVGI